MSQHIFVGTAAPNRQVKVLMGWDRPLQHVFMVVEQLGDAANDPVDEDLYLYSNLDEPEPENMTLDDFRSKLEELKIAVPESMFIETDRDRANNVGNRVVRHPM